MTQTASKYEQYFHFSTKTNRYERCSALSTKTCHYGSTPHIPSSVINVINEKGSYSRKDNPNREVILKVSVKGKPDVKVKLGPEGLSSVSCPNCETYLTNKSSKKLEATHEGIKCETCGKQFKLENSKVDVYHGDKKLLAEGNVRTQRWFHITNNPSWFDSITEQYDEHNPAQTMVHIGSREAALQRLEDIKKWTPNYEGHIYELVLTPDARVSNDIFYDENTECPSTVGEVKGSGYEAKGVTRYLNRYESPGTISLLANPHFLKLVKSKEI